MVDAASEGHTDFRFDAGIEKFEVVAYVGDLKVVGVAYFGVGQRQTSRRASDFIRGFGDERLTISEARIYAQHGAQLLDTCPFVILNLRNVDLIYAHEQMGGQQQAAAEPSGRPTGV